MNAQMVKLFLQNSVDNSTIDAWLWYGALGYIGKEKGLYQSRTLLNASGSPQVAQNLKESPASSLRKPSMVTTEVYVTRV